MLPGSARVAAVKSATRRGNSSAYSGRIGCRTTMKIMLGHHGQLIDLTQRRSGQHRPELADLLLVVPAGLARGQVGLAVPHAVADAPVPLAVDQHHEPDESRLLLQRRHDGITDSQ